MIRVAHHCYVVFFEASALGASLADEMEELAQMEATEATFWLRSGRIWCGATIMWGWKTRHGDTSLWNMLGI